MFVVDTNILVYAADRDAPVIRGNLVFDAHTAALMNEHGIQTIYTHDADFKRFPGLEVIDPL